LGVMERHGRVFPLFHVLADVGEFAEAEVLRSEANQPLTVDGFALRRDGKTRILLANFSASRQEVEVAGLEGEARLHRLDEQSVVLATHDPEAFRAQTGAPIKAVHEGFRLELAPFAVARIDMVTTL
ncbi:MAG: hypothetical protein ABI835_21020, partial [Chloroflexota bacterium]